MLKKKKSLWLFLVAANYQVTPLLEMLRYQTKIECFKPVIPSPVLNIEHILAYLVQGLTAKLRLLVILVSASLVLGLPPHLTWWPAQRTWGWGPCDRQ